MPSYEWKGRDRNGATQTGVLIGDSKDAVIAALRRQQIVVTTVKEKGKEIALPKFGGGIGSKTIAIFTRQFSVMIDAGLPLVQCLEILGAQQDNRTFQKVLFAVRQDVESGSTLADALRKHPNGYVSYTPFFLSPEVHERFSRGESNRTVPQNPPIGCWCGTWLAVGAEGEVSPCGILLDEVNCGNVRDMSFQEIIDTSPVFQRVLDRNLLEGKCGRCRYKFTCGGCRALAFYAHGDVMAEDPNCFFDPEDETAIATILREAVIAGELPPEALGAEAVDDHTLVIRLKGPTPYFLELLTHSTTFAIPGTGSPQPAVGNTPKTPSTMSAPPISTCWKTTAAASR